MICPYCGKEMILGHIYGDRYKLKWVDSKDDLGGVLQWFSKGIPLTDITKNSIDAYYCENDKIFIIKK